MLEMASLLQASQQPHQRNASAETGNICRCCYQSAALDLSHP